MKKIWSFIFIILILFLTNCQYSMVNYEIPNENFSKSKSKDNVYTRTQNGISTAIKAYSDSPPGMRIIIWIKNEQYDLIDYNINQIELYNKLIKREDVTV